MQCSERGPQKHAGGRVFSSSQQKKNKVRRRVWGLGPTQCCSEIALWALSLPPEPCWPKPFPSRGAYMGSGMCAVYALYRRTIVSQEPWTQEQECTGAVRMNCWLFTEGKQKLPTSAHKDHILQVPAALSSAKIWVQWEHLKKKKVLEATLSTLPYSTSSSSVLSLFHSAEICGLRFFKFDERFLVKLLVAAIVPLFKPADFFRSGGFVFCCFSEQKGFSTRDGLRGY